MSPEELRQYSVIRLSSGGRPVDAKLEYSETEHTFYATMEGSGLFGMDTGFRFKLAEGMIERIQRQPDGTIQLVL